MADNGKTVDDRGDTVSLNSLPLSAGKGEVFSLESVDPALNAKMHLVNNVRKRATVNILAVSEILSTNLISSSSVPLLVFFLAMPLTLLWQFI